MQAQQSISRHVVLVVEDEPAMIRLLSDNLRFDGYDVLVASDGEQGCSLALEAKPDLIVLDIMLPKLDGLAVCRRLRDAQVESRILMLTARCLEQDKVTGLKIGADDYLTKPFSLAEFLARAEALLRRARREPLDSYGFGDVSVQFDTHLAWKAGKEVELSPREFEILHYLIANKGRVITRSEMMSRVWGYAGESRTRTLDTHIGNLRQKLEDVPSAPVYIRTVHRIGYRFVG